VDGIARSSPLYAKYGARLDGLSARELLALRLDESAGTPDEAPARERRRRAAEATGGGSDTLGEFLESSTGRSLQREVVRGVFDLLKRRL
jgi:DNA double-strand break repair helicase HerA and related ATPase